jgi:predicted NBD/HSP70 family sugar kinase
LPGFTPAPLALQLEELADSAPDPDVIEDAQGWVLVHAAADAIVQCAEGVGGDVLRLGVCMPGLPTADGRGIRAMRNGPRMPRFLARLEECLAGRSVALAERPARLWADGEAAVAGEEHAVGGAAHGVRNVFVVGCGTGVAEGWKLAGRCLAREEASLRFAPAWALESGGRPFEDVLSARAMNAEFLRRNPGATDFPEVAATRGDPIAQKLLGETAEVFAELLFLRMIALAESDSGAILERILIGQRSAPLFADSALVPWFAEPLRNRLDALLREAQDSAMRAGYLANGCLDPELVVSSRLPAASAIGAVALENALAGGA